MANKKHITLKIFIFLITTDLLETLAQFCFKKSAGSAILIPGNLREMFTFIPRVAHSPFLWLGLFSVLALFIIWSAILSKIDLSVAVPVASFSYITVPLVSAIFLGERISGLRWSGIFFILLGVILVSLSARRKENST